MKLFAVYLGGYAPNCNVEVHDMVFVAGETFEETQPALVKKWFLKSYDRFHYDGYQDLSVVDGYKITLSHEKTNSDVKLFYVHLGAYVPGELNELHKNCFIVATNKSEAKSKARASWTGVQVPHKDVQLDVESCLQVESVDGFSLQIEPTDEKPDHDFHLGYNLIAKDIIRENL